MRSISIFTSITDSLTNFALVMMSLMIASKKSQPYALHSLAFSLKSNHENRDIFTKTRGKDLVLMQQMLRV